MSQSITTSVPKSTTDVVKANSVVDQAAFAKSKQEMVEQIRQLASEREAWENGAFRTANEALYVLLSKCYQIESTLCGNDVVSKTRCEILEEVAAELGYRFQKGTPAMNKIVRCIFGDVHRNRISSYATVLIEAKRQKIEIANISQFIVTNGGIGGINANRSETADLFESKHSEIKTLNDDQVHEKNCAHRDIVSASIQAPLTKFQKVEQVLKTISDEVIAIARGKKIAQLFDAKDLNRKFLLIATPQGDGSLTINALVRSHAAMNASLVSIYRDRKVAIKKTTEEKNSRATDEALYAARKSIVCQAVGL